MPKETRLTKQKKILEEELNNFKTFFTAEELLEKGRNRDSNLGIATVYRFLKEKTNNNATEVGNSIHSYYCDRRQVYSTQDKNHCHFVCTKCGKKTHFKIFDINFLKKSVKGKICHFQLDIHGICEDCQKDN